MGLHHRKSWFKATSLLCILFLTCSAALGESKPAETFPHPPTWIADQTVYEVNLRQFSTEGNVEGFRKQLPRLKALGVGTLWIMPVNPIGIEGHAGELGSYYAVRDYLGFNSEFGTVEQFKSMIDEAHRMGFFVILDWVANHSSLDHSWVKQHPDWYKHDEKGELVHPLPDWKDVVGFNYSNGDLRKAMIEAMSYWVREVGVDGFRCDTAEWVPLDFWVQARTALRAIKPIFFLAEGNKPELMNEAFDSAYAWNLPSNTEGIFKGTKSATDLCNFIKAEAKVVPARGFRLNFTSNHDKNSWEGTTKEQLGDSEKVATVLTFTLPGLPLIYNGQETGDAEHRLSFFSKDPIKWRDDPMADFYRMLIRLKRTNRALWESEGSAPVEFIDAATKDSVIAFTRESHGDKITVLLNFGPKSVEVPAPAGIAAMKPVLLDNQPRDDAKSIKLKAWDYRIWSSIKE